LSIKNIDHFVQITP